MPCTQEPPTTVKKTSIADCAELFDAVLSQGGEVTFSPKGASMLPMLRAFGDEVTIASPPERLKLGTVALYTVSGASGEERYILHRLVRRRQGMLVFCGDNRLEWDEAVKPVSVIGVVVRYRSRGGQHSVKGFLYRLYSLFMVLTAGAKRPALAVWHFCYRLFGKRGSRSKKERGGKA